MFLKVFFILGFALCSFCKEDKEYVSPSFSYKYEVSDEKTGDYKTHHESREGDVVKGYYSMMEADGTWREVHYTADKINGFKAVVTNSGIPQVSKKYKVQNEKQPTNKYPKRKFNVRIHPRFFVCAKRN